MVLECLYYSRNKLYPIIREDDTLFIVVIAGMTGRRGTAFPDAVESTVVFSTLLYINAGMSKVPAKDINGCHCGLSAILLKDSRQAGMTIIRKEI